MIKCLTKPLISKIMLIVQIFQDSGVILLDGGGGGSASTDGLDDDFSEDSDDSDIDVHRPVPPCNVVFVGANVDTGKSSLRSKARPKKVSKR